MEIVFDTDILANEKHDKLLTEHYDKILLWGSRGCFKANQEVVTDQGNKQISKVNKGDIVLSYNEVTKEIEYKEVINTFEYSNDKLYSIKLKNGTEINVTEDHKFYNNGKWVKIKDLIKSWYGDLEKD